MGDVLRGVHRSEAVRALLRNVLVTRHDEWEALAVDDMPMERIELAQSHPRQTHATSFRTLDGYRNARGPKTSRRACVQCRTTES